MSELSLSPHSELTESISTTELTTFYGVKLPIEVEKYRDKQSFHAGFNGWAALFGFQWFICKRLYWQGLLTLVWEIGIPILLAFSLKESLNIEQYKTNETLVNWGLAFSFSLGKIFTGFLANIMLYKRAVKEINRVDSLNLDNELHLKIIKEAGRLNVGGLVIFYFFIAILRIIFESTR